MAVPICRPCVGLPCTNPDDLASGIDGALYSSLDFSFIVQCPPLCFCQAGLFPRTIVILASTIPPVIPPILEPGSPIVLRLQGCTTLITRTLPEGSTQNEIAAAAQSMQAEWAGQQSLCIAAALPGVNCTPTDSISICNDAMDFLCKYTGQTVHVNAGIYCQTLSTIGLTPEQIAAATAVIKAALNANAQGIGCPLNGILCSVTFTDQTGLGTEWTLRATNLGQTSFDSSLFKIFNLQTNALLQNSLHATLNVGDANIVCLNAQPGVAPIGFYMTWMGITFFTYNNDLTNHNVQVLIQVNCGNS